MHKYFFYILLFISCSKAKDNDQLNQFTFDEVEHYSTGKKDSIISSIYQKNYKDLNSVEKLYLDVLGKEIPTKVTEKSFIKKLEKLNFRKREIDKSKIEKLEKIFNEPFCNELAENACIPMYRDIYIFKKNNEICGIAKVCFDCNIVYFVGDKTKWEGFGECEKYNELKKI